MRLFGDPAGWPRHDLVAFSTEFDTELMLAAYREGLFSMPLDAAHPGEMGWWSPVRRGVLFPESFRLSRSLRRSRHRFAVGFDQAFDQVLAGCADPGRPHGWINPVMSSAFLELHRQGWAHSAESWDESGRLVGGVIGMALSNAVLPMIGAMSQGAVQLPSLQAQTWMLGVGLMLAIGVVVGFLPAWRGMRLNIVDALAGR